MFLNTIQHLNKGTLISELDKELAELVRQIKCTGKAGSISLELTIKPATNDGEMVEVKDRIKVKAPEIPRRSSLFWPTEDGTLSRSNPNQAELPFREVTGGQGEQAPIAKVATA